MVHFSGASGCIGNCLANHQGHTCVAAPLSTIMSMYFVCCSLLLLSWMCAIIIGSWHCIPDTIWIGGLLSDDVANCGAGNASCCAC